MRIDAARYGGRCRCGREHQMATRLCVIEPGALERFDSYLEQAGVSGSVFRAVATLSFRP